MKKSFKLIVGAFVASCIALCGTASAYKICIDPGHGGSDPGATGNGLEEADVVLDMGLKFRDWMNKDTQDTSGGGSWNVYMTRSSDVYVSLSGRTSYANNNNVNRFMSIHANAFSSSSANGIETFCYTYGSSYSFDLRNKVYEEAVAAWPLTQRGKKTAGYYVIRYTNMPAELHEAAFITNYTDSTYLGSATQRDIHAKSELFAIQRHMGYSKYTPQTDVIVDNSDSGFSASSNWWTSSYTPGYYGDNYKVRATASTSDSAAWEATLPADGTYKVYVRYTSGGNRASSAPYIVYHANGSDVVYVNQQQNGGTWVSLGNFQMYQGTSVRVRLSCWTSSGDYVIGDAVKLVKQ